MTYRDPRCNFMGLNNCCVFLWKINHCAPPPTPKKRQQTFVLHAKDYKHEMTTYLFSIHKREGGGLQVPSQMKIFISNKLNWRILKSSKYQFKCHLLKLNSTLKIVFTLLHAVLQMHILTSPHLVQPRALALP